MTQRMFSLIFIKSYRASGTFIKTCGEDGKWHGDDDGICISEMTEPFCFCVHRLLNIRALSEYPTPKLICAPNVLVEIPPFSSEVEVKIQKPKTDLSMKRDVTIKPPWIKGDKVVLGTGAVNITFTAKHPISKLVASCTTTIYVVGKRSTLSPWETKQLISI